MCFRDTNDLIFPLSTWQHFLPVKPHVGHVHHANGAEEFPNAKQTEQDLQIHRCPGYPQKTIGKWWFNGGLMGFNQQNSDFNGMYPAW